MNLQTPAADPFEYLEAAGEMATIAWTASTSTGGFARSYAASTEETMTAIDASQGTSQS